MMFMNDAAELKDLASAAIFCGSPLEPKSERKYLVHPLFKDGQEWPVKTQIPCYHDVHQFESRPVFLPTHYCDEKKVYYGVGVFCSPSCAKRYALDHPSFNCPNQLVWLAQLCQEIKSPLPVQPAPPQLALDFFGGPMTLHQFRGSSGVFNVLFPPMISATMVLECPCLAPSLPSTSQGHSLFSADPKASEPVLTGLRRPAITNGITSSYTPADSAFDTFLTQPDLDDLEDLAVPKKKKRSESKAKEAPRKRKPPNREAFLKSPTKKKGPPGRTIASKTDSDTLEAVPEKRTGSLFKSPSSSSALRKGDLSSFMKKICLGSG